LSEQIEEHRLEVPRSARYYLLGARPGRVEQVWFVLHGYGQLAREFLEQFQTIANDTRTLVAPEALSRFYNAPASMESHAQSQVGATWMTREDREAEIEDYVRYLDRVAAAIRANGARVFVLGFSQGSATASRWAALGSTPIDTLILWAGLMADDLDISRYPKLKAMRIRFVIGERDEFLSAEKIDAHQRRLRGAGLEPTLIRFAGGHRLDRDTLRTLAAQREEEP
jgi:predicted esterase